MEKGTRKFWNWLLLQQYIFFFFYHCTNSSRQERTGTWWNYKSMYQIALHCLRNFIANHTTSIYI